MKNRNHVYIATGIATFMMVSFAVSTQWNPFPTTYHFAASAQETCTDSDGGLNYSVKGGASRGGTPPYTDSCYCPIGSDRTNLGACISGPFVGEWICNASGYTEMKTYECPNGCNNGACIAQANSACGDDVVDASKGEECDDGTENGKNGRCTTQCTRASCTDTDGGNNEFQKGVTRSGFGEVTGAEDICADDGKSVYEAYCDRNIITSSVRITCVNGCQNGACLRGTDISCSDSDGADISRQGIVRTNKPHWDPENVDSCLVRTGDGIFDDVASCSGEKCYLKEYICESSEPTYLNNQPVHCPNGCSAGACKKAVSTSCSDSDGGFAADVKGTTTGVFQSSDVQGSWTDECGIEGDPNILKEYICTSDGKVRNTSDICELGCLEGACKRKPISSPGNSPAYSIPPTAGFEDEVRVIKQDSSSKNWFKDLTVGTLENDAANFLAQNGIIGGFPDGTFQSRKLVNRAETAKFLMLARFKSIENRMNNGRFWDIPEGEWYVRFVMKAAEHGVINGHPDRSFRPQDPVKVGEFLKMLALTFDLPVNLTYQNVFMDVHPDDWFAPYAGIAITYDLPSFATHSEPEDGPWILQPERELTRGEVAAAMFTILAPYDF